MTAPAFSLVPVEGVSGRHAVKLEDGHYAGTVVAYGLVRPTVLDDGRLHVEFEYQVVEGDKTLENNQAFEAVCFDVLQALIERGGA